MFRADRQTGQLGLILRMRVKRGTTDHNSVVQHDREMLDLALQQLAWPMHQNTFLFHRFDQGNQRRNIIRLGFADILQRLTRHHGANPIMGEQLAQQGAILLVANQMDPPDP